MLPLEEELLGNEPALIRNVMAKTETKKLFLNLYKFINRTLPLSCGQIKDRSITTKSKIFDQKIQFYFKILQLISLLLNIVKAFVWINKCYFL